MNAKTEPNPSELHATIKLGVDAHAKWFYVANQYVLDLRISLPHRGLLRRVQRYIQFRLPNLPNLSD